MKCPCCQTGSQDLYCASCLNQGLENHAQARHILQTQLSASRARSEKILYGNPSPPQSTLSRTLSPPSSRFGTSPGFPLRSPSTPGLWAERNLRAQVHRLKQVNDELITEITRSRVRRAEMRKEVDQRRKQLGKRRANLDRLEHGAEESSSSSPLSYHLKNAVRWDGQEVNSPNQLLVKLDEQRDENSQTRSALRRARKVLVTELVRVYGVRPRKSPDPGSSTGNTITQGGGRRVQETGDKGGKWGADKGEMEMEIAGLWLPTPKHFTDQTSNHLNGTITHLLHLLHLITIYLEIKVPFGWSYGGSQSTSNVESEPPPARTMNSSTIIPPPISTITPLPPPASRSGFHIYPLPSSGSSGSGWQVGKPVVGVDDSLGYGRFVRLSAEREMASRDKGAFDEDAIDESSEEEHVSEGGKPGNHDDENEPEWARTENLNSWKKKSIFYVSTSRERWKRRHMQALTTHAVPSTTAQPDLPPLTEHPHSPRLPDSEPRKKDKYRLKEDAMILGYAMICYDVACLGWMNGLDFKSSETGAGDEKVDWGKVLNPLRVIWELVHSEDLGRFSHTPSISARSGNTSPHGEDMRTINYIPLPFSFVTLVRKATEAFGDHDDKTSDGNKREKDQEGAGLGADDWDLL